MSASEPTTTPTVVIDTKGVQGVIIQDEQVPSSLEHHFLVRFQNGQEVFVPVAMLTLHQDGRYYLDISIEAWLAEQEGHVRRSDHAVLDSTQAKADGQSHVFPVIEEKVNVSTRTRETGVVELRKTVSERTERVDLPLYGEEVEVERVAVNEFVDAPVPIRHEGDTMIVSLLEEVLVVEKRLLLREEVHVKKARREMHNSQTVKLREERVDIVRKPAAGQGHRQEDAQ